REIDPGTLLAQQILERDRRRHRAVALTRYRHLAVPDEAAGAVDHLVDLVGREAHRQPLGVDARDEVALVDPQQPQFDLVDIDRGQRQPRTVLPGQDIAGAREADLRLAVGDDNAGREFLAQLLAGRGREPAQHFHVVNRTVPQAVEAQGIAVGGDDAVELWFA